MSQILNTVKSKRLALKMTQVELSERTQTSSRTIISIEAQKYNPSLELAFKLAIALDTTVLELFTYKGDQ